MTLEIQPADPQFRRRFLIVATIGVMLIAVGIHGLNAYLLSLHRLAQDAQPVAAAKAMLAVRGMLILLIVGATALIFQLARTSQRTLEAERFPPPGTRMVSDTRIRRGREARRQGWIGWILAGLILVLTLLVCTWAHTIFGQLLNTTLRPTTIHVPRTPQI